MRPRLKERENDELSILAEMAVAASKQALDQANINASEIDG